MWCQYTMMDAWKQGIYSCPSSIPFRSAGDLQRCGKVSSYSGQKGLLQRYSHFSSFGRFQENQTPTWTIKCYAKTLEWMHESRVYIAVPLVFLFAVPETRKRVEKLAHMVVLKGLLQRYGHFHVLGDFKRPYRQPEQSNVMPIHFVGCMKAKYIQLLQ